MNITYARSGKEQTMVISGIEAAKLSTDEWWAFYYLVCYRFEHMLPTKTITALDYEELRDYISSQSGEFTMACAIVNRVWEMGAEVARKRAEPTTPPRKKWQRNVTEDAPQGTSENAGHQVQVQETPADDYIIYGGERGYRCKAVQQLDGCGRVIREFPSAVAAGKHYGIPAKGIQECCSGKLYTSGGRRWQYKAEA